MARKLAALCLHPKPNRLRSTRVAYRTNFGVITDDPRPTAWHPPAYPDRVGATGARATKQATRRCGRVDQAIGRCACDTIAGRDRRNRSERTRAAFILCLQCAIGGD